MSKQLKLKISSWLKSMHSRMPLRWLLQQVHKMMQKMQMLRIHSVLRIQLLLVMSLSTVSMELILKDLGKLREDTMNLKLSDVYWVRDGQDATFHLFQRKLL